MINVLIFTQADGRKSCFQWHHRLIRFFIQKHLKLSQQITTHTRSIPTKKGRGLASEKAICLRSTGRVWVNPQETVIKIQVKSQIFVEPRVLKSVTPKWLPKGPQHISVYTQKCFIRYHGWHAVSLIIKLYCTQIRCTALETGKRLQINYPGNSASKRRLG